MADEVITKAQNILDQRKEEINTLQRLFKKHADIPSIYNYLFVKDKRKSQKDIDKVLYSVRYTGLFNNIIGTKEVNLEQALIHYVSDKYSLPVEWHMYTVQSLQFSPSDNKFELTLNTKDGKRIKLKYDLNAKLDLTNAYDTDKQDTVDLTFWVEYKDVKDFPLQGTSTIAPDLYVGKEENAYLVYYKFLEEKFASLFHENKKLKQDYEFLAKVINYLGLIDNDIKDFGKLKPTYKFGHVTTERKQLLAWWADINYTHNNLEGNPESFSSLVLRNTFTAKENDEYFVQLDKFVTDFFNQKIVDKYKKQITSNLAPLMKDLHRQFDIKTTINTKRLSAKEVLEDLKIEM